MDIPFQPSRLRVVRPRGTDDIVVLELSGELDAGTTPKLAEAGAEVLAVDPAPEALVLDLSGLSFLSFAGLRLVQALHGDAGGTRLRVVTGDRQAVDGFLHATGLDAVLDTYRTRLAAVAAGDRAGFVSEARACWDAGS